MRSVPVLSITPRAGGTVIGARGVFDTPAADRLSMIVGDFVDRGGSIEHLILDLRATTRCSTAALQRVAELVGAGLRLLEAPAARPRRARTQPRRALG